MAGLRSRTSANNAISGSTSTGRATAAAGSFRQKGSNTPASIPAAIPSGISATARPSGFISPVSRIIAPASTKAPTPCAMVSPSVAAISAAPGVDQASTTGTRLCQDSSAEPAALPSEIARTQEAVCAGVAPSAAAAASTSAMVEP